MWDSAFQSKSSWNATFTFCVSCHETRQSELKTFCNLVCRPFQHLPSHSVGFSKVPFNVKLLFWLSFEPHNQHWQAAIDKKTHTIYATYPATKRKSSNGTSGDKNRAKWAADVKQSLTDQKQNSQNTDFIGHLGQISVNGCTLILAICSSDLLKWNWQH